METDVYRPCDGGKTGKNETGLKRARGTRSRILRVRDVTLMKYKRPTMYRLKPTCDGRKTGKNVTGLKRARRTLLSVLSGW